MFLLTELHTQNLTWRLLRVIPGAKVSTTVLSSVNVLTGLGTGSNVFLLHKKQRRYNGMGSQWLGSLSLMVSTPFQDTFYERYSQCSGVQN